jgi:choloylglycine hydrolase
MQPRLIGLLPVLLTLLIPWCFATACTSFVMDTPGGPVFGTNLDLFIPGDGLVLVNPRGLEKANYRTEADGERFRWTSEYGSVTFTLAGNGFAWGGMNEAGLTVSSMELASGEYPSPDGRPALYDGGWTQYILDTCGTVDEAAASLSHVTVREDHKTSHYLVADESGATLAVEFIDGETVIHSGGDMPVKAMSNMRYERALYAYEHGGTRWWWSNPGRSAERFSMCQQRANGFDAANDTSAVDYAMGTLVHHVAAPHTRWSIVFDIPQRGIHYRTDQSPTYKSVSFDAVDFSCEAGTRMLNVNTPREGDVTDRFMPYEPVTNLMVFRTFCDRYGIDISEDDARSLTRFYDAFDCVR